MQIYVDADACPKLIKQSLFRVANRVKVPITFVANRYTNTPSSPYLKVIQVPQGLDVADSKIVELVQAGDLVITADIPLASHVIEKEGFALNPRGELYTEENIRQILSVRNFMSELRENGVETGGPSAFHQRDCHAFANQLDRFLAQNFKTVI
ncbi:YaiI/YqxD family protein [Deltaproteobacteria bacterium TL4]